MWKALWRTRKASTAAFYHGRDKRKLKKSPIFSMVNCQILAIWMPLCQALIVCLCLPSLVCEKAILVVSGHHLSWWIPFASARKNCVMNIKIFMYGYNHSKIFYGGVYAKMSQVDWAWAGPPPVSCSYLFLWSNLSLDLRLTHCHFLKCLNSWCNYTLSRKRLSARKI